MALFSKTGGAAARCGTRHTHCLSHVIARTGAFPTRSWDERAEGVWGASLWRFHQRVSVLFLSLVAASHHPRHCPLDRVSQIGRHRRQRSLTLHWHVSTPSDVFGVGVKRQVAGALARKRVLRLLRHALHPGWLRRGRVAFEGRVARAAWKMCRGGGDVKRVGRGHDEVVGAIGGCTGL